MKNKEKATSRVPEIATDISCECASISPDMLKCDITDYLCHFSPTWSMKERLTEYVLNYCPRGEGNMSGEIILGNCSSDLRFLWLYFDS